MDQIMEMVDRISQLPEPIIHRILSFLPIKEVVKTRVLSKTWNRVWNTFPVLEFNRAFLKEAMRKRRCGYINAARKWHNILTKREELLNFVEQTLLSRYRQMLSLSKFMLYMPVCDSNCVPLINRCIGYAIERNVKELDIDIKMMDHRLYKLSEIVFDHCGSELPNVRYSSLRRLFLSGVYLDDHALQNLPNSCPGIEDLSFSRCGRKSLQVSGFLQLKKVNVQKWLELKRVDIKAPNLQYFKYHCDSIHARGEINITSCHNLKTLILYGVGMTEKSFHDHISVFPLLENLDLCKCDMLEHIKICGGLNCLQVSSFLQLKKVNVQNCSKLERVDIEAPNLQYFKYDKYHHDKYCYNRMPAVPCEINIASCKNLKTLILYGANMTEKSFHDHISGFPLLENLDLHSCDLLEHIKICGGLNCLQVSGFLQLKKVNVQSCSKLKRVDIEAPNLQYFKHKNIHYDGCEINIDSCKNLKTLILDGASMTEKSFHYHFSVFPLLEKLELRRCDMLPHISSLIKVKNDPPSLCSLEYSGTMVPFSMNAVALSRAELSILPKVIDTVWYVKLMECLGKLNRAEELILLCKLEAIIIPKELRQRLIPPPVSANHLTLQIRDQSRHATMESVDSVLWMFSHLDGLSMNSYCYNMSFKFVYEKQLDGEENLCWQHCLKEVKIVYDQKEDSCWHCGNEEAKIEEAEDVWNLKKFFFENAKNLEKVDISVHLEKDKYYNYSIFDD